MVCRFTKRTGREVSCKGLEQSAKTSAPQSIGRAELPTLFNTPLNNFNWKGDYNQPQRMSPAWCRVAIKYARTYSRQGSRPMTVIMLSLRLVGSKPDVLLFALQCRAWKPASLRESQLGAISASAPLVNLRERPLGRVGRGSSLESYELRGRNRLLAVSFSC